MSNQKLFSSTSKLFPYGKFSNDGGGGTETQYHDQAPGDIPTWSQKYVYRVGQEIYDPTTAVYYRCLVDHTASDIFANDLASLFWVSMSGPAFVLTIPVTNLFVDSLFGNNATALPNRFDRPYLTIAAAITAASAGQMVYVRKGNYTTGTMILKNNVDVFCEKDVVIDGGWADAASTVRCNILGFAKYSSVVASPAAHTLNITAGSTVRFEFDTINTNLAFVINPIAGLGTANVSIEGNSIVLTGFAAFGFGSTIRGTANVFMNITQSYTSELFPLLFRSNFAGLFTGYCPNMTCVYQGTADLGSGIRSSSTLTTCVINFYGNITLTNANGAATQYNACVHITRGIVSVYGNLTAIAAHGVVSDSQFLSGGGTVRVSGNITTNANCIKVGNNAVSVLVENGLLRTAGVDAVNRQAIVIGLSFQTAGSNVSVRNCRIFNNLNNGSLVNKGGAGNILNFYNCEGFSNGALGNFVTTLIAQVVNFHNVRSNKDNVAILVTDSFNPSGFIYDATFIMPTI